MKSRSVATILLMSLLFALPGSAWIPPTADSPLGERARAADGSGVQPVMASAADLAEPLAARARRDLASLGVDLDRGRLDLRGGRWATLWLREPLVPGTGAGNRLTAAVDGEGLADLAAKGFLGFVADHSEALRIDPEELRPAVGVHAGGDLIQIHAPRFVDGVPVRGAALSATINRGNLVLLGADLWGDVEIATAPAIDSAAAFDAVRAHLAPHGPSGLRAPARLEILPLQNGDDDEVVPGEGYRHRLVWVLALELPGAVERFEARVDAMSGEMVALEDTNRYQHRNVQGGVYPISNDGMLPDGVEVAGTPMPFTDVTHGGGTDTTDAGGNVTGVTGTMTTALSGPFLRIDDGCRAVRESSDDGDLDLGTSGGTDCVTPPGSSSLGNTHSARTAFYELNRIRQLGKAQLPGNGWLDSQMPARMNDSTLCNAFWNGTGVVFFRESPPCANLGELAGVLDHEWGHGMDDNGTNGTVSNPGEGIADVFSALRINSSCPGRGALGSVCGGFGDPCLPEFGCTAARDIDWERHVSMQPHDVPFVNANCGGSPHCRGILTSESIWDLTKRDLPAVYGMDSNTALEVATRLTYLGADNVASWFVTNAGDQGGCGGTSGYQQFLAADDDNGDLGDGTPHMQAIFDAFNRHDIACSTPAVVDGGCAGGPTEAPAVTATAADTGAGLAWGAVAGATRYKVFRTDGVFECDFGKAIVGETAATAFDDSGLQNGREYYYVVAGFGDSDACMGPASPCVTVTAGDSASIFADGFESGDTSAWSATVGGS